MKIIFVLFNVLLLWVIYKLYRQHQLGPKKRSSGRKVLATSSPAKGVKVDKLAEGSGPEAASGKRVEVHYTAWLESGKKVDSSYDKNETFRFTMGRRQVIPGWEAGMLGMQVGEIRRFTIEPEQAYGEKGKANVPPNATIIFEVELLSMV